MKKDGIFLSIKKLFIIIFFLGLFVFMSYLLGFERYIETLGIDKEWKFYASLSGIIFCSSILFLSIISLLILLISKYKNKRLKKDKIFLSRNKLSIISFFLSLGVFIWSFLGFEQNIETLGKDKEWKFYASLIGFIGFSSMFLLSTISWVLFLIRKYRNNLNNAS